MKRTRLVVAGVVAALALGAAAAPSVGAVTATPKTATPVAAAAAAQPAAVGAPLAVSITPFSAVPAACRYPSQRTPAITLAANPASVRGTQTFTLSGTLKLNSCFMQNWPVYIYSSTQPTGTFGLTSIAVTNAAGTFTVANNRIATTRYYVAVSVPANGVNSVQSSSVKVTWTR